MGNAAHIAMCMTELANGSPGLSSNLDGLNTFAVAVAVVVITFMLLRNQCGIGKASRTCGGMNEPSLETIAPPLRSKEGPSLVPWLSQSMS